MALNERDRKLDQFLPGNKNESMNGGELISDDRVRLILKMYSPILHQGISEASSFQSRSAGDKLSSAVPMVSEEVVRWHDHHQIITKTLKMAQEGKLFVPEIDSDSQNVLETNYEDEEYRSQSKQIQPRFAKRGFRVNLDEIIHTPVGHFDAQKAQFLVKPHAYLGVDRSSNSLYNAFIGLDTFVQDKFGRWVVDAIAGTTPGVDGPNWGDGPVYSPYMPARSSVWFNTRIDKKKENVLTGGRQGQFDTMFHCEIHHPEQIDTLVIPQDPTLRFFFWQLDTFLKRAALGGKRGFLALKSGK